LSHPKGNALPTVAAVAESAVPCKGNPRMHSLRGNDAEVPFKTPTGIVGLDEITGGGLPHGRTTLLLGGPGSGKTILSLKFLVHCARACKEPGIFVAFEETSKRIIANARSFGWNLP